MIRFGSNGSITISDPNHWTRFNRQSPLLVSVRCHHSIPEASLTVV